MVSPIAVVDLALPGFLAAWWNQPAAGTPYGAIDVIAVMVRADREL